MNQMNISEAIIVSVPTEHPLYLYEFIENELDNPDFKVKTIKTDHGVMAGIEWMLPTVVVAYLLKPFFEAFLQEAGKDFYILSKTKLKKFIIDNRELKYKYIAASQSTNKLSENYNQSVTISIKAMLHSKLMVTVLFDESILREDMDEVLEGLFSSLDLLYGRCQDEAPENTVDVRSSNVHEMFLIADPVVKEWKLVDKQQMMEKYRKF